MGTQNVHHKLVPKGSSVAEDDRIGTKGKNLQWNTAGTALCVKQGIGGRVFRNVFTTRSLESLREQSGYTKHYELARMKDLLI